MLKKLSRLKFDRKLIYFILITLVFFGVFMRPEYALDSFCILENQGDAIYDSFSQGRFLKGIFYILILKLNIGFGYKYIVSYLLSLFALVLAQFKLCRIISKDIKNELLSIIISIMIILNPFSIELMMFYEKGVMCLGILFAIYAFDLFNKNMEKKNIKYFILPSILMLLSDFSYQGISSIFIALSSIYIYKKSKNIKGFIINNIKMGLVYLIPALINVLIVRFIFVNTRVSGDVYIISTISAIFDQLPVMFKFFDIIPYSILLFVVYFISFIAFAIFRNSNYKEKLLDVFSYLYVFLAMFLSTIAPQLLQNTESVWLVPRSTYAFAAIFGLTFLLIMLKRPKSKYFKNGLVVLSIIVLFVQGYSFIKIEIDHYALNYLDRINSYKIGDKIREYEEETGKRVKYISYSEDQSKMYTYNGIRSRQDMNISGFSSDWSYRDMINHYTGLNLKDKKATKEDMKRCSSSNSNDFNIDKIIIENDTVKFCGF